MKKTVSILLAACIFILAGCTISDDKVITGDVKQDSEISAADGDSDKQNTDIAHETIPNEDLDDTVSEPEDALSPIDSLLLTLGAEYSDGGEYKENALAFAEALKTANTSLIAEYTGGKNEYYNFLSDIEISGYEVYPFEVSQEKILQMEAEGNYFAGLDSYLVAFDIAKGDGEYFSDGKSIFYMGFGQDPIAGGILGDFVPADEASEHIYFGTKADSQYTRYFLKEFLSLYREELVDGRNYPDSFDFKNSVHLITHLMARSGFYNDYPPYTMDEINSFIAHCFDGNKGLALTETRDFENWMVGNRSWLTREDEDKGRLYGCAYAHGGSTAEHKIIDVTSEGGDIYSYTVRVYADYSHFALAKELVFTLEEKKDSLPKLLLVIQRENTGRDAAYISV